MPSYLAENFGRPHPQSTPVLPELLVRPLSRSCCTAFGGCTGRAVAIIAGKEPNDEVTSLAATSIGKRLVRLCRLCPLWTLTGHSTEVSCSGCVLDDNGRQTTMYWYRPASRPTSSSTLSLTRKQPLDRQQWSQSREPRWPQRLTGSEAESPTWFREASLWHFPEVDERKRHQLTLEAPVDIEAKRSSWRKDVIDQI